MAASRVSEYKIGPFEYDEARRLVIEFSLALTNLGLTERFCIEGTPRSCVEYEGSQRNIYYHVVLRDKQPDQPKPKGLSTLDIKLAQAAGYTKGKVTHYEAFGKRLTMTQWAKAAGVTRPTLKSRIDAGLTMEEAITQIALKKAAP